MTSIMGQEIKIAPLKGCNWVKNFELGKTKNNFVHHFYTSCRIQKQRTIKRMTHFGIEFLNTITSINLASLCVERLAQPLEIPCGAWSNMMLSSSCKETLELSQVLFEFGTNIEDTLQKGSRVVQVETLNGSKLLPSFNYWLMLWDVFHWVGSSMLKYANWSHFLIFL